MDTSQISNTAPHLDLTAAAEVEAVINSLSEDQRAAIASWSDSILDYGYWYKKALAAAALQDDADLTYAATRPIFDRLTDANPGLHGAELAALTRPLIGRGVHLAQLQLLEASYRGVVEQIAA